MAVVRRRSPIAMRLGRARRRAVARRAQIASHVSAATSALADAWSPAPAPLPVGASPVLPRFDAPDVTGFGIRPLPLGDVPPADVPPADVPPGRLRRCAFRRLDVVPPTDPRGANSYAVMCLYVDAADPTPIGDLASAVGMCAACTFSGIFRPDES